MMAQPTKSRQQDLTGKQLLQLHLELDALNNTTVDAGEIELKPRQCYELTDHPLQIMFNTNCPQALREKIEAILNRYYN